MGARARGPAHLRGPRALRGAAAAETADGDGRRERRGHRTADGQADAPGRPSTRRRPQVRSRGHRSRPGRTGDTAGEAWAGGAAGRFAEVAAAWPAQTCRSAGGGVLGRRAEPCRSADECRSCPVGADLSAWPAHAQLPGRRRCPGRPTSAAAARSARTCRPGRRTRSCPAGADVPVGRRTPQLAGRHGRVGLAGARATAPPRRDGAWSGDPGGLGPPAVRRSC